ncbi:MAG TPA: acetyl-CoA carboxylase biotin carboxylase subunit [Gemmatimonadaceae bacterium]|nr:acetyl-CoA carboxylase biotin carboxylase subunit [Gemmatimonadaceae bacterium]
MFSKLLIANRGEIAVRVIRACRELGIASVAVYSEADAQAPHVRAADEAVRIGPAPSAESYLRADRLVEAALVTGAQAIHPGYGFLSEQAGFARLVIERGLTWIGPSPGAIAAMGSKTEARRAVAAAGVPVVPGTTDGLRDAVHAREVAARFGYPVLLKAAAGGGGKGMRVVRDPATLGEALDAARREARKAFGDDAVYVEKYIEGPRHVEVQILGDTYGTLVALGERECSIQRRHQKMIEEAPSVAVGPELRRRLGETAVAAARAVGYTNAGTCEFLLDRDGRFWFLEMNTRLQVEHPVTEMVTGVDLVAWQIRIAAGERLTLPAVIEPRGWAIECRITSEDPANGFLPSTGRVTHVQLPAGPGVRWDGAVEAGAEVGLHYDPLLGKLIAWGATRADAVARLRRALRELRIVGVETSREFHLRVLEDPEFVRGEVDIQWLERRLASLVRAPVPGKERRVAAVAGALLAHHARGGDGAAAGREGGAAGAAGAPAGGASGTAWRDAARREGLR